MILSFFTGQQYYKINKFYGYSFRYDCECEKAVFLRLSTFHNQEAAH